MFFSFERCLFFALFLTSLTYALGFYGNQSDVNWKSAETEHFNFIYPAEYTDLAAKASTYAEAVYDSIVNRYSKSIRKKINVTLNNSLYSNGSATPNENSMNLWLTNWDFKIRSSHSWLTDVVTHEFSHLVSIESGSKLPPSLFGVQASFSDYYNERTTTDFLTLIPFTLQPLWFAEGTAQFESSRMGFDSWDSHREMLLRTAALNDDLLSLEYMQDFADNSLDGELGPYTQGFSLVRYIAKHYGEQSIPKIWSEFSKPYRVTLSAAIKNVLGITESELYNAWKKEITKHYQNQKDSLGTLIEGIKITTDAFWQDFPVFTGNYIYGVSNFAGAWFDGGLFKMPLSLDSLSGINGNKVTTETDEPFIESFEGTIDITEYAKTGFKTKKPWFDKGIDVYNDSTNGPILAYVTYQNRDRNGHAYFDIALSDTNKNQTHVTYLANAIYPNFNKQGTAIAFVRREPYSTRFVLSKVPFFANAKESPLEEPIDIFIPDKNHPYYNIYSPKFSPNGKQIAFSFFDDQQRGIAIIDSDGKNFKIVSTKGFDERDVEWLSNDKIVFSSNRNGIFNLFEKDLVSNEERPLTNVIGGAFTPVLANDTLFFTEYDKDGFSLYKMHYKNAKTDSIIFTPDTLKNANGEIIIAKRDSIIPQATRDSLKKASTIQLYGTLFQKETKPLELVAREFAGVEKNYKSIPNVPLFVPLLNFSENAPDLTVFGEGELKAKAGLALLLSDPLKKNSIELGLLLELGKGFDYINTSGLNPSQEKEFFFNWLNHSTPLDLGVSYSYANYTSKDTVRYEDPRQHDGDSIGTNHYAIPMQSITALAGYSLFKKSDTLQFALSYDWADFNLFEDDFAWTYHKRISAMAGFGIYGDLESSKESAINGQGDGLFVYYQYSNSDLYRPGTFSESFYITESGSIKPNYRNFNLNEVGINLYGSVQSPLTGSRLAAGAKITGIIKWNTDAKEDTLDSYYFSPIFLEGYPYLRSSEDYTRSGSKTALAEAHYLLPIYDDWRNTLWIFSTRDFYLDVFAQIGAAWNTKWFDFEKFKNSNFWDRSVGLSLRMSNKIFGNIPFDISLTLARGLSRIGEKDDLKSGLKLNPINLPWIPKDYSPTRIKFAIGMGFNNSWQ